MNCGPETFGLRLPLCRTDDGPDSPRRNDDQIDDLRLPDEERTPIRGPPLHIRTAVRGEFTVEWAKVAGKGPLGSRAFLSDLVAVMLTTGLYVV